MIVRRIARQETGKQVAAYARVSTLDEAQDESYETQRAYYTRLISQAADWRFAGMYADHGITGTSAAKRPEFIRMIEDAKAGKMNLILCKSISRFSRNFKEAQEYVHLLKSYGVEVRFEKESVSSFDPASDMIFGTMAAVSQEESRSISENIKWAYRRLADQGIRHVGNNHMLGFDEVNGKLTPNRDAWIVRLVFEEFAAGKSYNEIIQLLNEKGARRMRSDRPFTWSAIQRTLTNEAYMGDRLIQKTPPQNYLTKKPDLAEAYESKYVYNDHTPIVGKDLWDAAQARLAREQNLREAGFCTRGNCHFMYGKVICGECGLPYRRCTARNSKGTYKTWRCRGHAECGNRHIREDTLIQEICGALGWAEMNETAFVETVEKVVVGEEAVSLVLNGGRELPKPAVIVPEPAGENRADASERPMTIHQPIEKAEVRETTVRNGMRVTRISRSASRETGKESA